MKMAALIPRINASSAGRRIVTVSWHWRPLPERDAPDGDASVLALGGSEFFTFR